MKRLLLTLAVLCAARLGAEGLSPTASAVALSPVAQAASGEASGLTYSFSFAQWDAFNGQPLSYTPLELGWAFSSGLRLQSGIDLFYYEGQDISTDTPPVPGRYSYNMLDWRTSVLYRVPWNFPLRPLLGLTFEAVNGTRRLTPDYVGGVDLNASAPSLSAWGFFGVGGLLGLEWLFSRDLSLQLSARYLATFDLVPSPLVVQTGLCLVL
jgi:hypothetical protein